MLGVATTPATRTEQVYDVLRSELLNGDLRPGQKLKMVELTERFGVSQSVIREALTRLTEQGLLVATPQRGFRVRDLSIEDIAELTETRIQIESLALRLAVERGDLQWETGILAAHHRLERTPVTGDDGTVSEDWSGSPPRLPSGPADRLQQPPARVGRQLAPGQRRALPPVVLGAHRRSPARPGPRNTGSSRNSPSPATRIGPSRC